jgi:hypothetical protein
MGEMMKRALVAFVAAAWLAAPAAADHTATHGVAGDVHESAIEIAPGPAAPTVQISVAPDAVGGWNLHVTTTNFRFAPEHASLPNIEGEGHAHIYVNGQKVARLYGPWYHIASLPPGDVEVAVSLNANDHREFSVGGRIVRATVTVRNATAAAPRTLH